MSLKAVISGGVLCLSLMGLTVSPPAHAQQIVAQFFGIFDQPWNQRLRPDTPFDQLNRLIIAFGKIVQKNDGHFSIDYDGDPNHVQDIFAQMRIKNPNAEIFLSVGGDGSETSYGGAANDPQFANNVAGFLKAAGFTGFDIDWETDLDRTNLNTLVKNLHSVLNSGGMKLTLDVWPFGDESYDMKVLSANLNQINIMSYGTDIDLTTCANTFTDAGFPASQIIGGVETESGYSGGTDTLGPGGTIVQKAEVAINGKFAGMMGWRLDNDYTTDKEPNRPTYLGAKTLWAAMTGQSISLLLPSIRSRNGLITSPGRNAYLFLPPRTSEMESSFPFESPHLRWHFKGAPRDPFLPEENCWGFSSSGSCTVL